MSQNRAAHGFFTASDLSKRSQEILRRLLEELEHLDLTGRLSAEDRITQTAHGGNGDVYTAYCWIGRKKFRVALKRLRFYIYKDKDFARLLAKELRVWSRLCHPNVLELLGYVLEENGFPSLISEWMENGTSLEYVKARPDTDILPLVLGIAQGLEYLHDHDVVHSDMKSDNVLISAAGVPRICDFGTARLLAASQTIAGASTMEKLKGTVRWLAVEFFTREQPEHTKESDVWAFGMTAYELLVKDRPYYHIRLDPQVIFAIAKGKKPLKPKDLDSSPLPAQTVWEICKLCWRDPENRCTASQIVMNILSGPLSPEPSSSGAAGTSEGVSKYDRPDLTQFYDEVFTWQKSNPNLSVSVPYQTKAGFASQPALSALPPVQRVSTRPSTAQSSRVSENGLRRSKRSKSRGAKVGCHNCEEGDIQCDGRKPVCNWCWLREQECIWPNETQPSRCNIF